MALQILTGATGLQAKMIRVVGGGSKNNLWNQIRADVTNLPIVTSREKEATALGAALTVFVGISQYSSSFLEAQKSISLEERMFEPSANQQVYEGLFKRYMNALDNLKVFYKYT